VHAAGVVHRDLKPSNLFLARRGRRIDQLTLLDFGVAKLVDLPSLTTTGQVYGTPMYMAPEQLKDSKHVDARSDLYALGAVLLECVTGTVPFPQLNAAHLVSEIVFGASPTVDGLRADLPHTLAQVIKRCLQKRAIDRYQNALAVIDALASL
jgi:serine/threonine-protein kinase